MNDEHDVKGRLKEQYAAIAAGQESSETDACGPFDPIEQARSVGYSDEEMRSVPEGVTCLGCSNPVPLADFKEGEIVLDLGSGGGLDAFLAARRVGERGRVIGIDMTAEMVAKATENANKGDYANVVFKTGEMENLPVKDESVDVAISNCVINHSSDKLATFKEVFRCLKPGGRIAIADLLAEGEFSGDVLQDKTWGEWIAVASGKQEYLDAIDRAGFKGVEIVNETSFGMSERDERLRGKIVSIQVKGRK